MIATLLMTYVIITFFIVMISLYSVPWAKKKKIAAAAESIFTTMEAMGSQSKKGGRGLLVVIDNGTRVLRQKALIWK